MSNARRPPPAVALCTSGPLAAKPAASASEREPRLEQHRTAHPDVPGECTLNAVKVPSPAITLRTIAVRCRCPIFPASGLVAAVVAALDVCTPPKRYAASQADIGTALTLRIAAFACIASALARSVGRAAVREAGDDLTDA
jgi:hypothetical protein